MARISRYLHAYLYAFSKQSCEPALHETVANRLAVVFLFFALYFIIIIFFWAKLLIDVIKSYPWLSAQAYFHCFEGAGAPWGSVLMRDG